MKRFTLALMLCSLTNIFFSNWQALADPVKRLAVNEGGTSSSKTYSILQLLVDLCEHRTKPLIVSVVSESLPHLRLGAMRDFRAILGESYDESKWNASEHIYTFRPGVIMEFFSADQPGKASGPRRDILYVNEVNNVPKVVFDQLDMRTRRFVFVDFNPVCEFWIHTLQGRPEVAWIHSTYLDARHVLPQIMIDKIEAKRLLDPNWWNVYGLGKIGNIEGLVHPFFAQEDVLPEHEVMKEFYGLDFGFTNDPTALIRNVILGDMELHSEELLYETGLDNNQIAKRMDQLGVPKHAVVEWADAAEPKSISEIEKYGFNIKACPKGPDSVRNGIQLVNQYHQFWTKGSLNCIKEQRNYRYITSKDGKITNVPTDDFNHGMDARRYALTGEKAKIGVQIF